MHARRLPVTRKGVPQKAVHRCSTGRFGRFGSGEVEMLKVW